MHTFRIASGTILPLGNVVFYWKTNSFECFSLFRPNVKHPRFGHQFRHHFWETSGRVFTFFGWPRFLHSFLNVVCSFVCSIWQPLARFSVPGQDIFIPRTDYFIPRSHLLTITHRNRHHYSPKLSLSLTRNVTLAHLLSTVTRCDAT